MADQKISAMPNASALTGDELVPIVQSGANVKTTLSGFNGFTTNRIALIRTTTLTLVADTATAISFDTTAFSQNISIANGSEITFAKAGQYLLSFDFQVQNANNQIESIDFWVQLNGVNYALSNVRYDVVESHGGNAGRMVASFSLPGIAAANDMIEIFCAATSSDVTLIALGAQTSPARPSTPAGVATIHQIG